MSSGPVPLRVATKVDPDLLDFDPANPRFSEVGKPPSDDVETVLALAEIADLSEIVQSISTNGYIDVEPLIVVADGARYTVLEGNRRLAAVKLLRDPQLAADSKIAVPSISDTVRRSLDSISVYRVSNPEEARDYIGFKHINGPHKWDALAKARFASQWYKAERKNGLSVQDVAKRLGDSNDTVLRLITGAFVLDQAKDEGLFDINDRYPGKSFAFSHLYTALTRPGYREFLGLSPEWRSAVPQPNPIPAGNLENLGLVMRWLYGSKEDKIQPVIRSQNPNIKQLGAVLLSPVAKAVMLQTGNLQAAYKEVEAPSDRFESALVQAVQSSEAALGHIGSADQDDETIVELSSRLVRTAGVIHRTLLADIEKDEE
jgi:hypothetical protein